MLFDDNTLRKLNRLTLVAARVRAGAIKGERRSSRRGSSVQFADYRDYSPGDDPRRLDWNIYARLERPFVKLFEEEEDLSVCVLVDGSRSMDWGEAGLNKFDYARRLAAGLGAVALASGDALSVAFLHAGRVAAEFGPARGQAALPRLFGFLEDQAPSGGTDLNASLRRFAAARRRPGLLILLSDLLAADGCQSGLRLLQGRGHDAVLVHILAPDEIDPALTGDLQLIDVETGGAQDVSLDGSLLARYRRGVRAWLHAARSEFRSRSVRYVGLTTDQPWDQSLLLEMRRSGIVK